MTGIDREDIENSVRAAVAAVIDATPESSPVALGDLVAAAQTVNGVIAATMLSPTYDATHDIIAVQPGEKPRVINPKVDVLVSFAGVI
jgi:streptogramin lyase